jgi:hypothetical protein
MVATKEFRWVKASERMPPAGKSVKVRGIFGNGVPFTAETVWVSSLVKWGGIPRGVAVEEWEEEVPPPPPLKMRAFNFLNKHRDDVGLAAAVELIRELLDEVERLEDEDDEEFDYPPYD